MPQCRPWFSVEKSACHGVRKQSQHDMERAPRLGWHLVVLMTMALVVRLAAGYWWQSRLPEGTRFRFGDSESYWVLGQCLVRGEPYEYGQDNRVFRTPGYPALLSGMFWLLGNDNPPVLWGRALSAICGSLAVGGGALLATQWFNWRAGLAAGWVTVFHPEAISLGTLVLSEAPFCPLMLLQFIAWQAAFSAGSSRPVGGSGVPSLPVSSSRSRSAAPTWGWGVLAGVAAGLATLMRPSWLLFSPLALAGGLLLLAMRRDQRRGTLGRLAIGTALGMIITLAPWWYRNYRVTGELVLTSLQVGASLYDGLSPQATGASDMRFVGPAVEHLRALDARATTPPAATFEARLDRSLRDESLGWARAHPRRVVELAGIKFWRMWNIWPNASDMGGRLGRWLIVAGFLPLIALLGYGFYQLVVGGRGSWEIWYFACLPAVYFTLLHTIFVSSIRYRQPALLPLIALAVGGWVATMGSFRATAARATSLTNAGRLAHD